MSKKIYCIAEFKAKQGKERELFEVLKSLEPNSNREDGCIYYTVTQQIESEFAQGTSDYSIVFNECWADIEAFEEHCRRDEIQDFFQTHCVAETGLVEDSNVRIFSDEA